MDNYVVNIQFFRHVNPILPLKQGVGGFNLNSRQKEINQRQPGYE